MMKVIACNLYFYTIFILLNGNFFLKSDSLKCLKSFFSFLKKRYVKISFIRLLDLFQDLGWLMATA